MHWVYLLTHVIVVAFGVFLIRAESTTCVAIGTSLIAAGITGWTVFLYVFLSRDVSARLRILTDFGVSNIFAARSIRIREEYDDRLSSAREHIDILGFGLRALREDYFDKFSGWREKAHVRILLLDPTFPTCAPYASQRDIEEKQSVGTIAQEVHDFVEAVLPILNSSGRYPFEVRLYRCLPTMNIFRIDDEVFFGPYLLKEPSRNSPTMLFRRGGLLFERVVGQFEAIWSETISKPVLRIGE
jgi:hypothetical protein